MSDSDKSKDSWGIQTQAEICSWGCLCQSLHDIPSIGSSMWKGPPGAREKPQALSESGKLECVCGREVIGDDELGTPIKP